MSAPTGSPRTRSHRQATRPALGRKALKGPTRTRTNPTQGRGEILSRDNSEAAPLIDTCTRRGQRSREDITDGRDDDGFRRVHRRQVHPPRGREVRQGPRRRAARPARPSRRRWATALASRRSRAAAPRSRVVVRAQTPSWHPDANPADEDPDAPTPGFASIDEAIAEVAAGRFVVVLDDEDRENEGDLLRAADKMTQESMHFMIRHTSGLVCVAVDDETADRLNLPLMVSSKENEDAMKTAFTVSCDLVRSTTGIPRVSARRPSRGSAPPRRARR